MIRLIYFIYLSVVVQICSAQISERFYNITRRDGLASGSITAILQDQRGIIWIGTKKGLNGYDGSKFEHYHTGNSNVTSNDISSLAIDDANILWIGTFGDGLHQMNLVTKRIQKVYDSKIGKKIISIHFDEFNGLLTLSEKGLCQLKSGKNSFEVIPLPRLADRGSALTKIDSSIWVGTSNGNLHQINQHGEHSIFSLAKLTADLFIQKIYSYSLDELLIGTRQQGLYRFNKKTGASSKVPINAVNIRDIITDKNGVFYIGTDGNGIYKIDGEKTANYLNQPLQINSLVSNAVQVCFEDRDHNVWFGTAWDGISFLDSRLDEIQLFHSDFTGINRSGVLHIFQEDENLWFGTDGDGLHIQFPNFLSIESLSEIPDHGYIQFIEKFDRFYCIGTFQSGFYIVEDLPNGRIKHLTVESGLPHDDVRKIIKLDSGKYLVATWGGGLIIYDQYENTFKKLPANSNPPKDIVTMLRLNKQELLVGTFGQGGFLLNLTDFSCKRIIPDLQNIMSIAKDDKGVWLGTWGQGLHIAQPPFSESMIISNESLGTKENVVSILPFEEEIWFATSEKIFHLSKKNEVEEIRLPPQQYHINSCLISDGHLYFGGTDGVIEFQPDKIQKGVSKPIEILDIKVINKTISDLGRPFQDSVSMFEHDQNLITFSYATPSYPVSKDESYELMLLPLQKNWVNVGSQRSMTYADLNAGEYTFKVRNAKSKLEQQFRFSISPPWWKTWWSYSLTILLFIGLLYLYRRYSFKLGRIKNQLEIERIGREKDMEIGNVKQRFFINISHEIRTPLTLIIGEIEQLAIKMGSSRSISNSITSLRNNGNHLLQLVNELLDLRKLDQEGIGLKVANGNFVKFCKEIFLSFVNKAESLSIAYEFICSEESIDLWYDRDQLEKVFFNLLSNAFKNTPTGGKISFVLAQGKSEISASIEDTGKGISKKDQKEIFKRFYQKENDQEATRNGYGIGLSIVQEVISLHKGEVDIESKEEHGSRFIVRLKKGKKHYTNGELIQDFTDSEVLRGYHELDAYEKEVTVKPDKETQVLIVEDNTEIRSLLVGSLSTKFTVRYATNGQEAYQMIHNELPDLVISDVMMPIMDGITLTRRLKKHPVTSHIPVILLTARTGTVFQKEGYETGADDYITKPFSPQLLTIRVMNILETRKRLRKQIRNELVTQPQDLNLTTPDEKFLKDIIEVVQKHLDNSELNADLIAREMGMSHSVIYKKLKALTGFNLVEFVRDYRLQQAGQMLKTYKLGIAETCYKVGLTDKKYFSKIFKKKFGLTPSDYARS
ncbi:MAG: response regulator [Bacteroidota bacterium]